MSTIGQLAEVSGTHFRPYISEVMPLVIDAIQVGLQATGHPVMATTCLWPFLVKAPARPARPDAFECLSGAFQRVLLCASVHASQDGSDPRRRVVAVRTLGLTVASCGNVMSPYLDFPQLLSVLLRMLHEGSQPQRREVIKVGDLESWAGCRPHIPTDACCHRGRTGSCLLLALLRVPHGRDKRPGGIC